MTRARSATATVWGQPPLWIPEGGHRIDRIEAEPIIAAHHYLHRYPSGWSYAYRLDEAVVVFSIPANPNLGPYLFGPDVQVRELARLWAPDGHRPDLLTQAIADAAKALRRDEGIEGLVSFADSVQGHHGGIYQAASWQYTGRSEEARVYRTEEGETVARRAFHSGGTSRIPHLKAERLPGKHRYVRCLTRRSRHALRVPALPHATRGYPS